MSDIENATQGEAVVDPIEVIYVGECESLSGRSVLTYAVGRHKEDGTLHLRIVRNGGSGMACTDWAGSSHVQSLVIAAEGLTAKSFHEIHPGRSINTGGFLLAVLKDLGLVRANAENTRVHEHVPTTTFQQLVTARIAAHKEQETKPVRKKGRAD